MQIGYKQQVHQVYKSDFTRFRRRRRLRSNCLDRGEVGPKGKKTTTRVKRLWKKSGTKLSLKAWARDQNGIAQEWLMNKGVV